MPLVPSLIKNEKDSHSRHPRLPAAPLISIMTIRAEASNRRKVTITTMPFQWLNDFTCSFHRHNRYMYLNSNRWYHNKWTRHIYQVIHVSSNKLHMGRDAKQLRCYLPKRKRRHSDKTPITGCTGSYHFDKLTVQPATKMKDIVASVHERSGNIVTSITPCQCSLLWLLLRPLAPQSVIKRTQHPCLRISDFSLSEYMLCVFILCVKCKGNLFNNSGIWCLKTLRAPLVRVGNK